mgnify:CR=1 FL=1|jgi:hypothetical protein
MIKNEFVDEFYDTIFFLCWSVKIGQRFNLLNLLFYTPYHLIFQSYLTNMVKGQAYKLMNCTILSVYHFGKYETYLKIFQSSQIFDIKFKIL